MAKRNVDRVRYRTSLPRCGFAIAAGGALAGLPIAALVAGGGDSSPLALVIAWLAGAIGAALVIAAFGAPVWFALNRVGARGPVAAALAGLAVALILFIGAQTRGFGLGGAPGEDARAISLAWLNAVATGLILAFLAAIIALVMWRVAYRPDRE